MLPDGTYVRDRGGEGTSSQEALYRYFSAWKVNMEASAAQKTAPVEPAPVRSEPVAAEKAPIPAPVKAMETTPPPEPIGLLRKIRSFFS